MIVAKVIILLITVTAAKHHHNSLRKSILDSKEKFFGNINHAIHSLMDNLFESVNLDGNFTKEANIKLLLTMHYDLSNIADENFEALNNIHSIIKLPGNLSQDRMKLDKAVDKVLTKNRFDVYGIIAGKRHKRKHTKRKYSKRASEKNITRQKVNISSGFNDSKEFTDFVIDFLAKINNLTMKDFKRSSKHGRVAVSSRRNLKAWEPPASIEFVYNDTNTRRIFRGKKTEVKKFPFVVSVHILGEFSCAGSIISRDLVITAASCLQVAHKNDFFKENPKSIYVRLGSDYTLKHGETIPVQELHFHPGYNPEFMRNNLALIRLEKRIRFSRQQKRIRRILWDRTPKKLTNATKGVLILGWGAMKSDQIMDRHQKLSYDMLKVYDLNDCKDLYSGDYVSNDNFCAGFTKNSGGACNGDVGGPGIVGSMLMGIISFGAPTCGSVEAPTVFTKLGYYVPWIESIMSIRDKQKQVNQQSKNSRRLNHKIFSINIVNFKNNKNKAFRTYDTDEYPENIQMLRNVLIELVKKDNRVVDEVLYGDLYDDFKEIFVSREKEGTKKAQFSYATDSFLTAFTKRFHSTTEHITTKQIYIETTLKDVDTSHRVFLDLFSEPQKKITPVTKNYTNDTLRIPSSETEYDNNDVKSNDYTDNYEDSTHEEEQGLSIEILPTTVEENYKQNEAKPTVPTRQKLIKQDNLYIMKNKHDVTNPYLEAKQYSIKSLKDRQNESKPNIVAKQKPGRQGNSKIKGYIQDETKSNLEAKEKQIRQDSFNGMKNKQSEAKSNFAAKPNQGRQENSNSEYPKPDETKPNLEAKQNQESFIEAKEIESGQGNSNIMGNKYKEAKQNFKTTKLYSWQGYIRNVNKEKEQISIESSKSSGDSTGTSLVRSERVSWDSLSEKPTKHNKKNYKRKRIDSFDKDSYSDEKESEILESVLSSQEFGTIRTTPYAGTRINKDLDINYWEEQNKRARNEEINTKDLQTLTVQERLATKPYLYDFDSSIEDIGNASNIPTQDTESSFEQDVLL